MLNTLLHVCRLSQLLLGIQVTCGRSLFFLLLGDDAEIRIHDTVYEVDSDTKLNYIFRLN